MCVAGVVVANRVEACWRASLISVGACLYMFWNSFGVIIALVSICWICGSVVARDSWHSPSRMKCK